MIAVEAIKMEVVEDEISDPIGGSFRVKFVTS